MRIACPGCAAEYEVPESRLARRKLVRCARCRTEWIPSTVTDDAPQPNPAEHLPPEAAAWPPMSAMDRLAAASPPRQSPALLLGAWVLTAVVLTGLLLATLIWRDAIVRVWPQSALILVPFGHTAPDPAQITAKKTE